MNKVIKDGLICALGWVIANFIWQAVFGHHWEVAAERSYFQAWAIIYFAWQHRQFQDSPS